MITGKKFIEYASHMGCNFFVSVPCSYLTPLLNSLLSFDGLQHVMASSEGEAVGIASGARLAGKVPVVLMQNSGLGNAVNPLTSLNHIFKIPVLLICSWRGSPGRLDEPQHELMGKITHQLLDTLQIPHAAFPKMESEIAPSLERAFQSMEERQLPYVLVVEPDALAEEPLKYSPASRALSPSVHNSVTVEGNDITRAEAIGVISNELPKHAAIIATTGKTGRELYCLSESERNLYIVGSMGCASAVALGVALNSNRNVAVLDGDGAALMKLGNLSTIGSAEPANLIHFLLDNGMHDSTGGQPTNSTNVDFPKIAAACGYHNIWACSGSDELMIACQKSLLIPGPHFIHVRIRVGTLPNLPRPSIGPSEVGARFARFVQNNNEILVQKAS